ncbi:unnamed protein product [Colias eurytheme]|nr:unnamed protein product [Colias eurytheme]
MEVKGMQLEKFDGTNFKQWKFQIKCALRAKGLDINIPKPATNATQWNKDDGMAMYIITSAMDFKQVALIENCESALEVLTKLESIYEQKSEMTKMMLHERFYQYKMSTGDSIAQHIAKVESMAKQLKENGEDISETAIITKVLSTLPPKYRSLRQAWMSLDPKQQTIINLTARLLDEEASFNVEEEDETALLVAKHNSKKLNNLSSKVNNESNDRTHRFICYNCGKRGHFSRECRAPRQSKTRKPHKEGADMLAFYVENNSCNNEENTWILDSGASAHMTFRKDFFVELFECNQKSLTLGNKQSVEVSGIGKVMIQRYVNEQWETSELNDVLYVPSLRRNLFSEGVIIRKCYSIVKKNSSALIYKNHNVVMSANIKENNLYELNIKTVLPDTCNLVQNKQSDLRMWHERLGHINVKQIKNMTANSVVNGLEMIDNGQNSFVCEACAYGKQCKFPFQKSERGELQPGDLVYSDVCGPMSTSSIQGMRYFLLFKDAATSYRHVYFMKHKSDVMEVFKRYNAMIKNKFMHNVRILHTDNGTEYVNNVFKEYLEREGIVHERSAAYTPEQNGRAERENRTIVESARSMLYARDVPLELWAEAVQCATYILNRTSSTQTPNTTAFELWNGIKPQVGHVKVFGSTGYVHVPDQLRTKFEKKSKKMMLVGYDNMNYRMYDMNTNKITISRNVIFDEHYVPSTRKNIAQISIVDDEVTNMNDSETQEPHADDTLVNSPSTESENSMLSCTSDDPDYEPSRELEDSTIDSINLRPRINRNYEANLVELSLPQTYTEALSSPQKSEWSKAIKEELSAHKENNTWTAVERSDQRTLTTKWVFTIKKNENNQIVRYKARLCARGFNQIKDVDYQEIFSPTTRYDSIRTILSITAKYNLDIQQFDVKTAFLNGFLEENIFIDIPEGLSIKGDFVLKLNKSLYGLKQASRCWNKTFTEFLFKYGFVQSQADNCIYIGHFNGSKVFLIIYVDDALVISSNKQLIREIIEYLKQAFKIKELELKYFVGMQIERINNSIYINQQNYISQIIEKFCMSDANPASTPADVNVIISKNVHENVVEFPYREAIGCLLFLSSVSRPDISFAVNVLSRYVNNPSPQHVNSVKRVIRYLIKSKHLCIKYSRESNDLIGYSDSDFASDIDTRKSTTGYLFMMNGGPITWSSQKQKTVALSTTEAEFVAASECAKEILWLQQLLSDLGESYDCITLNVDNQSAIRLINNPVYHKRTKHIDVKYNFIREKVHYAGINDLDAKRTYGIIPFSENTTKGYYGLDYSGVTKNGTKVMGMINGGSVSNEIKANPNLLWPVPEYWTLEDAATVPLAYCMALYVLNIKGKFAPGIKVLIHSGTGALGQAAISICLAYDCEVYTTVSDCSKKRFLKKLFPKLKEENIGNSRDIAFGDMVLSSTKGTGCDIVLGSLKGELKNATLKCCGRCGVTIDTSFIRSREDYNFGIHCLTNDRTFKIINFSSIFEPGKELVRKQLQLQLSEGIAKGYVRPLTRVVYSPNEVLRAFNLVATSKHRGRVLIDMKQDICMEKARLNCSPNNAHIVLSDSDVLAMQLVNRLVDRGVRNLNLIYEGRSESLLFKIRMWRKTGVEVKIQEKEDIADKNIILNILQDDKKNNIEGVYAILTNDNKFDKVNEFLEDLDSQTRVLCPQLRYFAIINNENVIGEQVTLLRAKHGYPATLIRLSSLLKNELNDGQHQMSIRSAIDAVEEALISQEAVSKAQLVPADNKSLIDDVAKWAGVKLPVEIDENLTLSDLGMDVDRAQAVQAGLKNEYNISYREDEISDLTIQRIGQIEELLFESEYKDTTGLETFYSYVDSDELFATTEMAFLSTLTNSASMRDDEFDSSQKFLCIVPGVEGHYKRFSEMCERLKLPALVLQPGLAMAKNETLQDVALRFAKTLLKRTELKENFYLLGYESGVIIALEMAAILEENVLCSMMKDFPPKTMKRQLMEKNRGNMDT